MHRFGRAAEVASPVPSRSTGRTMEVGGVAPEEPRPRSRRQPLRLRAAYKRFLLLLARVSTGLRIQSPPPPPPRKLNIDQGEDRISALPEDLLLGILERLDLREAVRAGAVSTRWRHLPHRLSRLHLDVRHFGGDSSAVESMEAFTGAMCRLLSASACPPAECKCAIKTLLLDFFPVSEPHLSSIGRAVEDLVTRGETDSLDFLIFSPHGSCTTDRLRAEMGQQFMSFSRACSLAFRWLTVLTLEDLVFGHSDVTDLINACGRLVHLTLSCCRLVDLHSVLKIDTPSSGLLELNFIFFRCTWIELISVPKLTDVRCESPRFVNPQVRFGYVPELRDVSLFSRAIASQAPVTLSECLPRSARNLSHLCLDFGTEMIWIKPEHPQQLTAIFSNLTDVTLLYIFPECDLSWTLFILEAAPALQIFELSRERHSCAEVTEKTNVVWEPSKDLKHPNLKLLLLFGFEEEDKVTNYIRLVMERAAGLKRIELCGEYPCKKCDAIDPTRYQVDEARRRRIKERLTRGSSSSVEIVMC